MRSDCKQSRIIATLTNQVKLIGCNNLNLQEVKKIRQYYIKNMQLQEESSKHCGESKIAEVGFVKAPFQDALGEEQEGEGNKPDV